VKVVEGSEIYNFPIHYFVHFYSTFWSYTCSNRGTGKHFGQPRRAVPPARAPRAPPETRTLPRSRAPRPHAPSAWASRPQHVVPTTAVPSPAPTCVAGVPAAYKSPGSASRVRAAATPALAATGRPATRPEPPAGASRCRRGEPRARQAALPNCGTLHPAWRMLELAHLLTASTQPPPRRSTRHRGSLRPVPPRELAGATTTPTKGQNRV
jgi:hypothetical protein